MKIGILGTGAFGLALASCLVDKNEVVTWTKFEDEKNDILSKGFNPIFPEYIVDERITITSNIKEAILDSDIIIISIPSKFIVDIIDDIKPYINDQEILIASKGFIEDAYISNILKNELKSNKISVLAGGSFAIDVVNKSKVGFTIATNSIESYNLVRSTFNDDYVSFDFTDDINGVELCASIKNIYAIIFGILNGINASETTKALYFTNMINDIKNIMVNLNYKTDTISTYAGIGDLYLTCNSLKSRNFTLGTILASNNREKIIYYINNNTVEGYYNLNTIYKLLKNNGIHSILIKELYEIIYNNKKVMLFN